MTRPVAAPSPAEANPRLPFAVPVVVVHYRAPEWCMRTVASIVASDGVDTRIVVVNNSGDPLALPAGVGEVVPKRNLGYAGGANEGFRHLEAEASKAGMVLIACHDVSFASHSIEMLERALRDNPSVGVLAPVFPDGGAVVGTSTDGPHLTAGLVPRAWVSGTAMLIRTKCFVDLGGFDELFGSYVEDLDFCTRAWNLGWVVGTVEGARAHACGTAVANAFTFRVANNLYGRFKHRGVRALARGIAWQIIVCSRLAVRLVTSADRKAVTRELRWRSGGSVLGVSKVARAILAQRLQPWLLDRLPSLRQ